MATEDIFCNRVISTSYRPTPAVTQDYLPQSIIRALINGNCTSFAHISARDSAHPVLLDCINTATRAEKDKSDFFQLLVYGKMYEAFYELFSNNYVRIVDVESKSKKYRALMRVTNYIDEHYIDGLSLDEVAASTGISRYYVSHLFKELMNTPPTARLLRSPLCPASIISPTSTARSSCISTRRHPPIAKHNPAGFAL